MTLATPTADAYRDPKRYLFLMAPLMSVIPFGAMAAYLFAPAPLAGNVAWALVPILFLYGVVPLVDGIIGEDRSNPPESAVPDMAEDRFYQYVAWSIIPLYWLHLIIGMWFVTTQPLPLWAQIIWVIGMGFWMGGCNLVGHELGHKTDRVNQWLAQAALICIGNGHFCTEHNRNHHVKVSTPEDCTSARMGESVYAFMWRDMIGAAQGAWALEAKRLRNRGQAKWSRHNRLLVSWGLSALAAAALTVWLGWQVLPYLVLYSFTAIFSLTLANYIEHYGLLRQKDEHGRYEPCAPRHSWNTNHAFSNLLTLHLQRHSDHHANPMRPYQALRDFEDLPRLPSGYPGTFGLALVPPLWAKVMDPKVMAWAGGDLAKVNTCPKALARLEARWGQKPREAQTISAS